MNQNNLSYLNLIYKLIAFLLTIVTAITAWVYLAPLSSAVVKNGNITHSKSTLMITAQNSANIQTLFISNYQHVQQGQTLIVFDNKTLKLEYTNTIDNYIKELTKLVYLQKTLNIKSNKKELLNLQQYDNHVNKAVFEQYYSSYFNNKIKKDNSENNIRKQKKILEVSNIQIINNKLKLLELELKLVDEKLEVFNILHKQNMASTIKITELKREKIAIKKQLSNTLTDINQAKLSSVNADKIHQNYIHNENTLLLEQLEQSLQVVSELQFLKNKIEIELNNLILIAPIAGYILNLNKIGVDSYVTKQQTLFEIIPDSALIIKVNIDNKDINNIRLDQVVEVSLSAFNSRTTNPVQARISKIATTAITIDNAPDAYPVEVTFINELKVLQLKAGMPVQVTIINEKRTVLDYLFSTIKHSVNQSLRE
ncbi:MAG: HlyD family efflux transporter periplasmic adaptor subunit [Saccharospirillaceae bacterium]|nr:HlyD family efflux transporter periplasmic adaptor subunit [Pseudomonadales bacterium]NRB77720.1 HlyD family efflux transporter periplasmic adaptor subunit [Saccharospirillaceae bacterium]